MTRPAAWVALVALVVLVGACTPSGVGSGAGGSGGDSDSTGGDSLVPAAEFGACSIFLTGSCAAGLVCADTGGGERCLAPCALPDGACPAGRRCVPRYDEPAEGFCAVERDPFDTCNPPGQLGACPTDGTCLTLLLAMPDRCVPVCDAGTLGDYDEVAACPALPLELGGHATACTPITLGTGAGGLCSFESALEGPCDDAALRCNDGGDRIDTDPDAEAGGPGEADRGAPDCLPTPDGGICLRVCSVDGGATQSPCECPGGSPADADCDPLPDPGLAWACAGGAGLPSGIWACRAVEDCSADATACDDNTITGRTACADTPFDTGPSRVCTIP